MAVDAIVELVPPESTTVEIELEDTTDGPS
jgi:hypothetical protein